MVWLTDGRSLVDLSPRHPEHEEALSAMVRELRASSVEVHREVLRQLFPKVERWARAFVGPGPDAPDVAQEALCQIAAALHRYEGRASVSTFAHRITTRVALRRRRKRAPTVELDEAAVVESGPGPREALLQRRRLERLYRHLDRMPEKRRTAIVLCAIQGLSPQEAAELVGCQPVAMRNRLHHAKRELEERLRRDPGFEEDAR